MKTYIVGGYVRDMLLGKKPKDIDYVVVGSTIEEMLSKGFKQVGNSFPVFLHPETGDEYALARKEVSTGNGHNDFECQFSPDVTLEEDLYRRDLTINAIALDQESGKLIDPYDGARHIADRVLHPVSEAFKEDPLRVLRAARFNARYPDFEYSDKLLDYCYEVALDGHLDNLTPERVWKEMEGALKSEAPGIFFNRLKFTNLFTEIDRLIGIPQNEEHHPEICTHLHTFMVLDCANRTFEDSEVNFACLLHDLGKYTSYVTNGDALEHEEHGAKIVTEFCHNWKVPNTYRDVAWLTAKYHTKVHGILGRGPNKMTRPKSIYNLFVESGAITKPDRFKKVLMACVADARGRGANAKQRAEFESKPYPQMQYLLECLEAVRSLNTKDLTSGLLSKGKSGKMIGEAVRVAKIDAIRSVQHKWKRGER